VDADDAYCDSSLPMEDRVADLLARLTVEEKVRSLQKIFEVDKGGVVIIRLDERDCHCRCRSRALPILVLMVAVVLTVLFLDLR